MSFNGVSMIVIALCNFMPSWKNLWFLSSCTPETSWRVKDFVFPEFQVCIEFSERADLRKLSFASDSDGHDDEVFQQRLSENIAIWDNYIPLMIWASLHTVSSVYMMMHKLKVSMTTSNDKVEWHYFLGLYIKLNFVCSYDQIISCSRKTFVFLEMA